GASKNPNYEANRRYYLEYVTKVITERGMVPFYWDNGGTLNQADNFGLFTRSTAAVAYPDIVAAIVRGATSDYQLADIVKP
ncbi:MAG TPA: hypothetical protein VLC09_14710, partial [Polyangiaceae bacterium]|nr:hypothetical protein [Polyangiaceae bacterium]